MAWAVEMFSCGLAKVLTGDIALVFLEPLVNRLPCLSNVLYSTFLAGDTVDYIRSLAVCSNIEVYLIVACSCFDGFRVVVVNIMTCHTFMAGFETSNLSFFSLWRVRYLGSDEMFSQVLLSPKSYQGWLP